MIVDGQIAPLFGYQPYEADVRYPDGEPRNFPQGHHSRVLEPGSFADFLRGIWQASGARRRPQYRPLKQRLTVQPNPWFGVAGGKTVNMLWAYTNRVKTWYDLLRPSVQAILGDFDDPPSLLCFRIQHVRH